MAPSQREFLALSTRICRKRVVEKHTYPARMYKKKVEKRTSAALLKRESELLERFNLTIPGGDEARASVLDSKPKKAKKFSIKKKRKRKEGESEEEEFEAELVSSGETADDALAAAKSILKDKKEELANPKYYSTEKSGTSSPRVYHSAYTRPKTFTAISIPLTLEEKEGKNQKDLEEKDDARDDSAPGALKKFDAVASGSSSLSSIAAAAAKSPRPKKRKLSAVAQEEQKQLISTLLDLSELLIKPSFGDLRPKLEKLMPEKLAVFLSVSRRSQPQAAAPDSARFEAIFREVNKLGAGRLMQGANTLEQNASTRYLQLSRAFSSTVMKVESAQGLSQLTFEIPSGLEPIVTEVMEKLNK